MTMSLTGVNFLMDWIWNTQVVKLILQKYHIIIMILIRWDWESTLAVTEGPLVLMLVTGQVQKMANLVSAVTSVPY